MKWQDITEVLSGRTVTETSDIKTENRSGNIYSDSHTFDWDLHKQKPYQENLCE